MRPKGLQTPRPGTKLRVQLELPMEGRRLHRVGEAEIVRGDAVLLRLTEASAAGRTAVEWLREGYLEPQYWGSASTLRLR